MEIRPMKDSDVEPVAAVHQAAFPRQSCSHEWIHCNFAAFPRMQFFVADSNGEIQGFVHWTQKSGFREQVVLELEQIAVYPSIHGQGIGSRLIRESMPLVKAQLAERGATLKHLVVTTRADNAAQRLYRKELGAEIEATITNLYSADEVFMVARNVTEMIRFP